MAQPKMAVELRARRAEKSCKLSSSEERFLRRRISADVARVMEKARATLLIAGDGTVLTCQERLSPIIRGLAIVGPTESFGGHEYVVLEEIGLNRSVPFARGHRPRTNGRRSNKIVEERIRVFDLTNQQAHAVFPSLLEKLEALAKTHVLRWKTTQNGEGFHFRTERRYYYKGRMKSRDTGAVRMPSIRFAIPSDSPLVPLFLAQARGCDYTEAKIKGLTGIIGEMIRPLHKGYKEPFVKHYPIPELLDFVDDYTLPIEFIREAIQGLHSKTAHLKSPLLELFSEHPDRIDGSLRIPLIDDAPEIHWVRESKQKGSTFFDIFPRGVLEQNNAQTGREDEDEEVPF